VHCGGYIGNEESPIEHSHKTISGGSCRVPCQPQRLTAVEVVEIGGHPGHLLFSAVVEDRDALCKEEVCQRVPASHREVK